MTRLAVGFTQRIQLPWLEWAAQLAASDISPAQAREELQTRLRPIVSVGGHDNRSNRGKVVGILMTTWVTPPSHLAAFHEDALQMFATAPKAQHIALHWGMAMAVYPYFGLIVDTVGRLLALQETINLSQVTRRVEEVYGQRKSIERGTQRAFYALHDWGVIRKTEQYSVYEATPRLPVNEPRLTLWLVESALITKNVQSVPWSAAWPLGDN